MAQGPSFLGWVVVASTPARALACLVTSEGTQQGTCWE